MPFAVKYQFSFSDDLAPGTKSLAPRYRASFLFPDYAGAVIEILPGEEPATLELADPSDNIFEPLLPQTYTFSLLCQEYWQAQDLYVTDGKQIQVLIERQDISVSDQYTVLRRGWLTSSELKEDYAPKPYMVEIKAICGLTLLKDIPLTGADGKRLKGMVSLSQVIRTALSKIGLGGNLVTGVNLYEQNELTPPALVNGLADPFKCPLNKVGVDAETFIKDDNSVMSCWGALLKVIHTDLRLTQLNGNWYLVRVSEMGGGWDPWNAANSVQTIHTRTYFGDDFTTAPVSHQSIDLSAVINGSDTGTKVAADPSEYWKKTPQSGVRVEFKFGRWRSVLPDFSQYNPATTLPEGWYPSSLVPSQHAFEGTGTELDPYRFVIYGGSDNYVNSGQGAIYCYLPYTEESREAKNYLKRTVTGKVWLENVRAAQLWFIAERIENGKLAGPFQAIGSDGNSLSEWKRTGDLKKNEAVTTRINNTQKVNGVLVAKPGWLDYSIELPIIDGVLGFYLFLGMAEKLDETDPNKTQLVKYTAPVMEVEQPDLGLDGMQETIVRAGKLVKDAALTIELGDVPLAAAPFQRLGTLYTSLGIANGTTRLWHRPDWAILPNGFIANGGKPKTLLSWLANTYANQLISSATVFEGDLVGDLPWGPLSVLRFKDVPDWKSMPLTRWKWSMRLRTHTVTAPELLTDSVVTDQGKTIPPVKEWQTPGGMVPVNVGDDGEPVETTSKPLVKPDDQLKQKLIDLGFRPAYSTAIVAPPGMALGTTGRYGAQVYNNNQMLGSVVALFRRQIKFKWPP